jgi:hypothetical protein
MAQATRAPRRRSTVPEIQAVSGRRFHAVKTEDEPEELIASQDTRTRLQRGQDELAYERDYRRGKARQRGSSGRRRALTERDLPGVGLSVNDSAGFVLGMLAWVLTVQYIRGGTAGVKAWLRAKFLNQATGARPK